MFLCFARLGYGQNKVCIQSSYREQILPQTNLRDIFKDSRDFIGFAAME